MLFSADRSTPAAAGETAAEHAYSPSQERQSAARVRHDDAEFRTTHRRSAEYQVDHRPRAVECEFDHWPRISERALLPTYRRGGMNEDYCCPAVELIEDRIQPLVTEVHAVEVGQHDYAVELERIQRVGDLFQRTVNVRKRQAGEAAKAPAIVPNSARGKLVDGSSQKTGFCVVAEVHSGRRYRQHPGRDSHSVHHRERGLRAPLRCRKPIRRTANGIDHFLAILRAQIMEMDVDAVRELICHRGRPSDSVVCAA